MSDVIPAAEPAAPPAPEPGQPEALHAPEVAGPVDLSGDVTPPADARLDAIEARLAVLEKVAGITS